MSMNRRPPSLSSLYPPSPGANQRSVNLLRSGSGTTMTRRAAPTASPISPTRRIASGQYRNSSEGVAAVLGGSVPGLSPSRPRTRGISTPAATTRPGSSSAALLPPSPGAATFSLPYDCRVQPSTGKTANIPVHMSVGLGSLQGFRPTMEDTHLHIIHGAHAGGQPVSLFAIFDGHCGRRVADLGAKVFPDCFFSHPLLGRNNAQALVESVVNTDRHIFQAMGNTEGGSTLIAAAVHNRMLFVSCLGDARAVVFESGVDGTGVTIAMSEDHKPQDPKETQRIVRCGGTVQMGRVCGCLAVSRALGDFEFKFQGARFIPNKELMVSNVADIRQLNITDQTRFLILACDGLWDVLTNEDATAFVVDFLRRIPTTKVTTVPPSGEQVNVPSASPELQRHLDQCALRLSDHAIERGSMDNVSVMIVAFRPDLIAELQAGMPAAPPSRSGLPSPGSRLNASGSGLRSSSGRFGASSRF